MASQSPFSPVQMLSVLGGITLLWWLLKAIWGLGFRVRAYVLSEVWKGVDLTSYGPWAVVTGATAGIGKAYAHELAKRGLNVVLISRSLDKLKKVAREIEEQHGRSTKVIQMDFTQGSESYKPVQAALQDLEVGVLVNNVGIVTTKPELFLDTPNLDQFIDNMMNCNVLSVVKMTRIVLPQMVARKKGVIINLSSGAGRRPFPCATLYGTSKTFIDHFSRALNVEYSSQGIIVQSILPLFVDSNMTRLVPNFFKMDAGAFAHQALNTVGITSRTSGSLSHSIQTFMFQMLFPEWLNLSPLGAVLSMFVSVMKNEETSCPERKEE
ncbi:very-long-chain 3-oxoacyl-CoA reductase-like [Hemicordylus capensis]|uniref:very-long-chain 3-oxoacyl-CoA reductase-like n=1 Tax=Hemicordylus capensis TaxID=884348 RepID=UPI002304C4CC|nr:very-long-chain 3-oxoacyl-CoA reductase-like [Hemicordylus capensis]